MKSLFYTFILAFCTVQFSYAQDKTPVEVIRYYDGSVFFGYTIEDDGRYVNFELASTGDTIHLAKYLIKGQLNTEDNIITEGGRYHKKVGYLTSVRGTFGGNIEGPTAQLEVWVAQLIKPNLGIGMGLGYNVSAIGSPRWETLPFAEVFLYGRYYLNNNRFRPFIDLKLGAAIPTYSAPWLQYSAGPLLQGGVGLQFATKRKCKWELRISELIQRTVIEPDPHELQFQIDPFNPSFITTKLVLTRFQIGAALIF